MTGVGRSDDLATWFIFNLAFFDPDNKIRIFSIIETSAEWVSELKAFKHLGQSGILINYDEVNERYRSAFINHEGEAYLLKTSYIDEVDYEIVKIPRASLQYFESIDATFEQGEASIEKIDKKRL